MTRLALLFALGFALAACTPKVENVALAGPFTLTLDFSNAAPARDATRSIHAAIVLAGKSFDCAKAIADGAPGSPFGTADFAYPITAPAALPAVAEGAQPAFFFEARNGTGQAIARACVIAPAPIGDARMELSAKFTAIGACATNDFLCGADVGLCRNAKPLSVGTTTGSLSGTGAAHGACLADGGGEQAFVFTAPQAGRFVFDASNSPTRLAVYARKSCEDRSSEIACASDDLGAAGIALDLAQGEQLDVIVDALPGASGPFRLDVRLDDDCDNPPVLAVGDTTVTLPSGVGATSGSCRTDADREVVYRFTAATDGLYVFETPDTSAHAVYLRATCQDPLSELACDEYYSLGDKAFASANLVAGQTVFVFVDGGEASTVLLRVRRSDRLVTMVRGVPVPAGQFLRGSGDPTRPASEQPQRAIRLSTFSIDERPVTSDEYAACVAAKLCPPAPDCAAAPGTPALCIGHRQARAYCTAVGKRLPTSAEWEKAARGGCDQRGSADCEAGIDDVLYPWGNDPPTCDRAALAHCGATDAVPVGTHPAGDSIYGVHDLVGDVFEWTSDCRDAGETYATDPEQDPVWKGATCQSFVVRGAPVNSEASDAVVSGWSAAPDVGIRYQGFRCAITPK